MSQENKVNLHDQFEDLVASMNIPDQRKAANSANARWFLRNAPILNRRHAALDEVLQVARQLASIQ